MRNQRRGRPDPGEFDRPRPRYGEGNYRMPFGTHGNRGNSEGLSNNYIERLFDHDRDKWRSWGFISPYRGYQGRIARRRREFELWLHWHPHRDEVGIRMLYEWDQGNGLPCNYTLNGRGRPSSSIDIRDRRYRPPYNIDRSVCVQRLTGNIPHEILRDLRRRVHERHPHTQRPHGAGGRSHPPPPFFESSRNTHIPPRRQHDNRDRSNSRRRHHRTNADYDPHFSTGYPPYTNPRTHHHPPHDYEDEDEDEDDYSDDLSSQSSNESYTSTPRHQSPHIVFPYPSPYNGHALGNNRRNSRHGRHETYTDDEDEDEYFDHRARGSTRRNAGRSRRGSRHYDGDHVDYDFSGDEHGRYDGF